ncbi:MAG TPA: ABC transporter permease [Caulobacteraceae bacterium]|jgi:putative ABC transport system permease protein|nr:ABC transporter permease [Caulobacteraceae bacterium]
MNLIKQIWAVTAMNVRALPQRAGTSLVTVIGVATVIAVMVSLLAIGQGLLLSVGRNVRADDAVVLSSGTAASYMGSISRTAAAIIGDAPGVATDSAGRPMVSPEALVIVEVTKLNGDSANIGFAGVTPEGRVMNPSLHLIAGRRFRPAVRELIAGRSASGQYRNLKLGDHVTLRGTDWTVVGIFEDNGGQSENALIGDAETVMSAFGRGNFQMVNVRLQSPAAFTRFKDALTSNPQLSVEVRRTAEYTKEQLKPLTSIINFVGYFIGIVMAVGAAFGAVNTMYSAVDARVREIATLRAIGFGGTAVVVSVMVESLLLAIPGALLGVAIAWILFNGRAVSSLGLTFPLAVTPGLFELAIVWALAIGLIGGLAPSIRAANLPVATALRAT